jgi:hypothetical protein
MGLGHGLNKCQPEPASGRVLPFHKTLKYAAADLGGKTGPIIFDHQFGKALVRSETNIDPATGGQVYKFIFQQIAQSAIDKSKVSLNFNAALQVSSYLMTPVGHGRHVQVE